MKRASVIFIFYLYLIANFALAQGELGSATLSDIEAPEKALQPTEKYLTDSPTNSLTTSFLAALEKRILNSLEKNQSQNLSPTFAQILKLRQDPNLLNDKLRWEILSKADTEAEYDFARGRFTELSISGQVSNLDLFKLRLNGFYGRTQSLLIISCFLIIIGCCLFLFLLPGYLVLMLKGITNIFIRKERKIAVKWRQHLTTDLGDDEYTRLLKQLGLDEHATENQIKKAYRDAAKSLHPDLKAGNTEGQDDLIILKALYDRILEIRGSWFGAKKS